MQQKSILLSKRLEVQNDPNLDVVVSDSHFDLLKGFWVHSGEPVVSNMVNSGSDEFGTLTTLTREGVDASENSRPPLFSTTITKTREAADTIESSYSINLSSLVTESREAVDQSEFSS